MIVEATGCKVILPGLCIDVERSLKRQRDSPDLAVLRQLAHLHI